MDVPALDLAATAAAANHGVFSSAASAARTALRAAARASLLAHPAGGAAVERAALGPPGARPPALALWRAGWYEEISARRARVGVDAAGGGTGGAATLGKVRERVGSGAGELPKRFSFFFDPPRSAR